MKRNQIRNMVLAAFFMALGLVLPFLTGQIPAIGSRLLPMHIPVLLCGFVCGTPYGFIVGLLTPIIRSLIWQAPPLYPTAVAMMFELATYGALAGFFYKAFPKKPSYIYISLIFSMIGGRLVWGLAQLILLWLGGKPFTLELFMAGAFINAVPGIVIQLIIIPAILIALRDAKLWK